MPRDDWANARARDIGRRAIREDRAERPLPKGKTPRKKRNPAARKLRGLKLSTGQFAGVPVASVPTWFLKSILSGNEATGPEKAAAKAVLAQRGCRV